MAAKSNFPINSTDLNRDAWQQTVVIFCDSGPVCLDLRFCPIFVKAATHDELLNRSFQLVAFTLASRTSLCAIPLRPFHVVTQRQLLDPQERP